MDSIEISRKKARLEKYRDLKLADATTGLGSHRDRHERYALRNKDIRGGIADEFKTCINIIACFALTGYAGQALAAPVSAKQDQLHKDRNLMKKTADAEARRPSR